MTIALLTNYLAPYRLPLYERLAAQYDLEVLLYGGGQRYIPPWFTDLDSQIAAAPFPARRLDARMETTGLARHYEILIAPHAGGAILPAAYLSARRFRRRFILWASIWAEPHSAAHLAARPAIRHIYRHADSVLAYGEHVRRFVNSIRGHDHDVFVAPQSVEPELFARPVTEAAIAALRSEYRLPEGPLVLLSGRLVAEKGVSVALAAWREHAPGATLVLAGEGPLRAQAEKAPGVRAIGTVPRDHLAVAYAAARFTLVPSVPTRRFREPWGLVVNEAMHQGRPVIASETVGAVAGGLVRHEQTGLVVPTDDPPALSAAIHRLLQDDPLRVRLGTNGHEAVGTYTYEAMAAAFDRAIALARTGGARRTGTLRTGIRRAASRTGRPRSG